MSAENVLTQPQGWVPETWKTQRLWEPRPEKVGGWRQAERKSKKDVIEVPPAKTT